MFWFHKSKIETDFLFPYCNFLKLLYNNINGDSFRLIHCLFTARKLAVIN